MVNHFIECISVLQDTWEKHCESHLYTCKIMRGVTGRLLTVEILISAVLLLHLSFFIIQTMTKCEPVTPRASAFEHQTCFYH